MSEAYTYFYAVDKEKHGSFTQHKIVDCLSFDDFAYALEAADLSWYEKCGEIGKDHTPYIDEILTPAMEAEGCDKQEELQELIDFLNKYQGFKVMVFTENDYHS